MIGNQFDTIQHHTLKYILLSNFKLRGSFWIINATGCNYILLVKDVMYRERKLKIKGLLRLFRYFCAANCDWINYKEYNHSLTF